MVTLLQDTFTDANGTALTSHAMTVGSGWTSLAGTWTIQSNQASEAGGTANVEATADAGQADVVAAIDIAVPAGGLTTIASGLCLRGPDASNGWVVVIENDGAGPYLGIAERVAGTNTAKGSPAPCSGVPGTTVTLTVTLSGASISAVLSGGGSAGESTSYGSAASNQTVTKHGLFNFGASGYTCCALDNFLVTGAGGASAPIGVMRVIKQAVNRAGTY